MANVVEGRDLRKTYAPGTPAQVEVLKGIDITIAGGEFVAIVGQSGSGKSTLLNLLGALDTPTGGSLRVAGQEVSGLSSDGLADLRASAIGFVFQFHYLLDEYTCLENAEMPLRVRQGGVTADQRERIQTMMREVGLEQQLHKYPNSVSGGQQQRVAVVRALAHHPRLVLADEPTGNLDSHSGAQVFDLMRRMTRTSGVAFVMVTHDDRLARAADRVLRVEDGLLTAD